MSSNWVILVLAFPRLNMEMRTQNAKKDSKNSKFLCGTESEDRDSFLPYALFDTTGRGFPLRSGRQL